MRIVVLDGYTLNPGDLDWGSLRQFGDCHVYDRTPVNETVERASGAQVVLTNKALLTREHIEALPQLRYIGVLATGFNNVDATAARERAVPVTNVPAYGSQSVAQMTIALLLELTQNVGDHSAAVRQSRWSQCPDFCFWDHPLVELDGLTFGIIGFGRIGQAVARIALALGMKVLAYTPHLPAATGIHAGFVDLERLLTQSDVVSLHCPLNAKTEKLINGQRLAQMKNSAFLINTSRGGLVDEQALADALSNRQLAGAAVDVLSSEPPDPQNPLLEASRCLVTPHIAWATQAARRRLLNMAIDNLDAFLQGKPRNVVN